MDNQIRVVIAGGPYCGKTTVINELSTQGFRTINEATTEIIKKEQEAGNNEPWLEREKFQKKIMDLQIQQFNSAKNNVITFYDRGLVDGLAYYHLDGIDPPKELTEHASKKRYNLVFIPDLIEGFKPDKTRGESLEERKLVHELIRKCYSDHGYNVINIPSISVSERVLFIKKKISEHKLLLKDNIRREQDLNLHIR